MIYARLSRACLVFSFIASSIHSLSLSFHSLTKQVHVRTYGASFFVSRSTPTSLPAVGGYPSSPRNALKQEERCACLRSGDGTPCHPLWPTPVLRSAALGRHDPGRGGVSGRSSCWSKRSIYGLEHLAGAVRAHSAGELFAGLLGQERG